MSEFAPQVSIVVPLFNEEENVSILQSELRITLVGIDHEIILVDDGSVDRTLEKIKRGPRTRVMHFEKNAGQSAALYAGCKAARGATIVMIDGDLQNDPADIPRLLAEISKGADMVCGYRTNRQDTLQKRMISRVANFVRSRYARDGIRDTGCTLKAMRRECVEAFVPFQGNAPVHGLAGQGGRPSNCRNPSQPPDAPFRPNQVWLRQPRAKDGKRPARRALAH